MKKRYLVVLLAVVVAASTRGAAQSTDPTGQAVWRTIDIGQPLITGYSTLMPCTQPVTSCPVIMIQSSASRAASSEETTFVYQPLTGDNEIIARVQTTSGGGVEGAAGVAVRTALAPGSPAVSLWATKSGQLVLESRQQTGGATDRRAFTPLQQSVWLKLERKGTQVSAFQSNDGSQWAALASVALPIASSIYMGLVGASQDPTGRLTATLSDVRVNSLSALPLGWSESFIGGTGQVGSSQYLSGMFVAVATAGTIGDTADRFHFVHTRVSGDVELVARIVAGGQFSRSEAGVMVRESLAPGAAHVVLALSNTNTRVIKRRVGTGLPVVAVSGGARTAPWWLKVIRRGTAITTFESVDGVTWTPVAADAIALPSSFFVGLSVAAGAAPAGHAIFDRVAVRAVAANRPPDVAITEPLQSAALGAGATVALSASATDPDDRVDAVEFFVDGLLVGVDTATPYRATWTKASAGPHVITAVAVDSDGARVTSAPRSVVVTAATAPATSTDPGGHANSTSIAGSSTTSQPSSTSTTPSPVVVATPQASATVSPWRLVFSPSPDHDRLVDRYRLEVYALSPRRLVYGRDLGRPAVVAGDCTVDVSQPFSALAPGSYEAVVTAVDDGTYLSSIGATLSFTR